MIDLRELSEICRSSELHDLKVGLTPGEADSIADEIERLTKNEQATLKTIETIQVIRMADEAEIERLSAEVQSAFEAGWSMYADNGLQPRVPDQMKHAYKHWKSTLSGSQELCGCEVGDCEGAPNCQIMAGKDPLDTDDSREK